MADMTDLLTTLPISRCRRQLQDAGIGGGGRRFFHQKSLLRTGGFVNLSPTNGPKQHHKRKTGEMQYSRKRDTARSGYPQLPEYVPARESLPSFSSWMHPAAPVVGKRKDEDEDQRSARAAKRHASERKIIAGGVCR